MSKKIAAAAVSALIIAVALAVIYDAVTGRSKTDSFFAMNTFVNCDVTGKDPDGVCAEIRRETTRLDYDVLSKTSESSELYRINLESGGSAGRELTAVLEAAKQLEKDSDGAFCAGLGRLVSLWGIGTDEQRVPDEREITDALNGIFDWETDKNGNVTLGEGCSLDLGSAGKGYACDRAIGIIKENKCRRAVIAVGGSVALYSKQPKERFTVGIRDPYGDEDDVIAKLTLGSCFVSTSGSYERRFSSDGSEYHHIFSPATGHPAESGLVSVTVISDSGLMSDLLSTACFVLGEKRGEELVRKYGAQAVFIDNDGGFYCTEGAEEALEIL